MGITHRYVKTDLTIRTEQWQFMLRTVSFVKRGMTCLFPNQKQSGQRQRLAKTGADYRPPNSKSDYWDLIDQSIKNVFGTPHKFIVLGDFNTNFLSNPSPQLLDVINFINLQQVVTHPTRITEKSATLIDLVLTSCTDIISHVDVLPPVCSDHAMQCIKLDHKTKHSPSFKRTIYDYGKPDVKKLSNELSNVKWVDTVSLQLFSDTTRYGKKNVCL